MTTDSACPGGSDRRTHIRRIDAAFQHDGGSSESDEAQSARRRDRPVYREHLDIDELQRRTRFEARVREVAGAE